MDPRAGKLCSRCKWWKLFDQFRRDASRHDGREALCVACRNTPPSEEVALFERTRRARDEQVRERRLPMLRSALARMRELGHMEPAE